MYHLITFVGLDKKWSQWTKDSAEAFSIAKQALDNEVARHCIIQLFHSYESMMNDDEIVPGYKITKEHF